MDYYELAELADGVLEIGGDSVEDLAEALDRLSEGEREDLLHSDFLNAYQVFYYHFRENPSELGQERLILTPASLIAGGVLVEEVDDYEILFLLEGSVPIVAVSDGKAVLARFEGGSAYRGAFRWIEES
ncbi:MAG: hypothetical protein QMD46_11770 [Methanomicrobiales archaeon]|nr:hypothetical protein [Methanomicrobiales archaeon]MDI6877205.1 hypothetical protein [Methanomicrobiales archaeon]